MAVPKLTKEVAQFNSCQSCSSTAPLYDLGFGRWCEPCVIAAGTFTNAVKAAEEIWRRESPARKIQANEYANDLAQKQIKRQTEKYGFDPFEKDAPLTDLTLYALRDKILADGFEPNKPSVEYFVAKDKKVVIDW